MENLQIWTNTKKSKKKKRKIFGANKGALTASQRCTKVYQNSHLGHDPSTAILSGLSSV